jgi:hypothetical protein
MREELATVHRALRHIITCLNHQDGLSFRFACGLAAGGRMFHVEPGQENSNSKCGGKLLA